MKSPPTLSVLFGLATFVAALALLAGSLSGCAAVGTIATGVAYGVAAIVSVPVGAVTSAAGDAIEEDKQEAAMEAERKVERMIQTGISEAKANQVLTEQMTVGGIPVQQKSQPENLRVAILPFARPRARSTNSQVEF